MLCYLDPTEIQKYGRLLLANVWHFFVNVLRDLVGRCELFGMWLVCLQLMIFCSGLECSFYGMKHLLGDIIDTVNQSEESRFNCTLDFKYFDWWFVHSLNIGIALNNFIS